MKAVDRVREWGFNRLYPDRDAAFGELYPDRVERIQEAVHHLTQAVVDGPWNQDLGSLIENIAETDKWMVMQAIERMGWEVISGAGEESTEERERAVKASVQLWKYSPLGQWVIWSWTAWGLGERLNITVQENDDAQVIWRNFYNNTRTRRVMRSDRVKYLSWWTLVYGNVFIGLYTSTVDGTSKATELRSDQIVRILKHPNDDMVPLFYERRWRPAGTSMDVSWYYPDALALREGLLDKRIPGGNGKTVAQMAGVPHDGYRTDWGRKMENGVPPEAQPATVASIQHIAHNRKEPYSLWGWPILTTARYFMNAHRQFVRSRLAVAQSKAAVTRRKTVSGGSRSVKAMIAKLQSGLSSTSSVETNPVPTAGSTEVENDQIRTSDLSMRTGAQDATADNNLFAWMAVLGGGLLPVSAGLDTARWATAIEMDHVQSALFKDYQEFVAGWIREMVENVVGLHDLYKYEQVPEGEQEPGSTGDFTVDVSVDSLSMSDFPGVAGPISNLLNSLAPLMANGLIPLPASRRILRALWRITLQALNVGNVDEITSNDMFQVDDEMVPVVDQPTAQQAKVEEKIARVIRENANGGSVEWEGVADWAVGELLDAYAEPA